MHSFPTMASTERPQASSADSGLFNGAIAPEPISLFLSGDVMTARGIDQAYNPPPPTHTQNVSYSPNDGRRSSSRLSVAEIDSYAHPTAPLLVRNAFTTVVVLCITGLGASGR